MNCPMCGEQMETISASEERLMRWCPKCGTRNMPENEFGFRSPWLAYQEYYPREDEHDPNPGGHYTKQGVVKG